MAENPPAFPVSTIDGFTHEGMALRDWFAGQAVGGILANSENAVSGAEPTNSALSNPGFPQWLAMTAYRVADAMLAARTQEPQP